MGESRPADLGTTIAGVGLPFAAMNAAGAWSSTAAELRALARSESGAIVLRTTTLHPFVHPQYRTLQNPGYDKLLPLVRELTGVARCPIVASVAGTTADEYAILAQAFAEAGAGLVEANLADPWVAATLAPWDDAAARRHLFARLAGTAVRVAIRLPERIGCGYRALGEDLRVSGLGVIVIRNDFAGLERFLLEAGRDFEVIALGGVRSGYDVSRALAKGARAVQLDAALLAEGPAIFARLAREMRIARGERS
jgi:dihydroorotate dehydrogenase